MPRTLHEKYKKWWETRTFDEFELQRKAFEFEEKYFSDMTLEDYKKDLTAAEVLIKGKWIECAGDILEPGSVSMDVWRFHIIKKTEYDGRCIPSQKVIRIADKYKSDDSTLLHEMIHAYESMLPTSYVQFVTIKLYDKLLRRLSRSRLHRYLIIDQHRDNLVHTPLFLLKSLDLDLRLKQELGTVYAYGRTDLLSK